MNTDDPRVLHLAGTPRVRGFEHGREIPGLLLAYWEELLRDVGERAERPMSEGELRTWLRDRAGLTALVAPDLDEEVRGIAEGAGVPHEIALGVTFGEEVSDLASALGAYRPRQTRCLSVVVPPEHTTTGGYLLAQTWDGPDWTPDPFVFTVEEPQGRSAFLSDPGWVGGVGVNDRGLGSVHTSTLIDHAPPGMPYPFVARRILQADHVDAAAALVSEVPNTAGCHFIIADDQHLVDVEAAGTVSVSLTYTGKMLSTCAHFSDPECIAKQTRPDDPVSQYRVTRLLGLTNQRAPISPSDLFEILSDHVEGPRGRTVCMHPGEIRSLGCVVIDPTARSIWAKASNPCEDRPICKVTITDTGFRTRLINSKSTESAY